MAWQYALNAIISDHFRSDINSSFSIPHILLSEHLEPETVPLHCNSPQMTVLFVVHGSFTSTDIILIGIAKLSHMRWIVYQWKLPEKVSLISY